MRWLIAGGALHLHHAFAPDAFAAQSAALTNGAVVLPGPVLSALADGIAETSRIVALWRGPLGEAARTPVSNVVDCVARDETTVTAATRGEDGLPDASIAVAAAMTMRAGTIAVGGYRFRQAALDAEIAAADPSAMVVALPAALLGNRFVCHTDFA